MARQVPAVFDFSKNEFVLNENPMREQPPSGDANVQVPVSTGRISRAVANAAPPAGSLEPEIQTSQAIVLTHAQPMVQRVAPITAPGMRQMAYNVFTIDTRDFVEGGVLDIELQVAGNSQTDGSFDLFPGNAPTQGRPARTLVGRYDVRRGTSTRMEYRFAPGQVFAFGLEGNWFSPRGATGTVRFRVSVHR
jgi:hypothetical protein